MSIVGKVSYKLHFL